MGGLVDHVDIVGIEVERGHSGARRLADAAEGDHRFRQVDHPADRHAPGDRGGDAEPQGQARRQGQRSQADEDQQIFEAAVAQRKGGRHRMIGERVRRDQQPGGQHDVERAGQVRQPGRIVAGLDEPVLPGTDEEEEQQPSDDEPIGGIEIRDEAEEHRDHGERRRARPELQPGPLALRPCQHRPEPLAAALLQRGRLGLSDDRAADILNRNTHHSALGPGRPIRKAQTGEPNSLYPSAGRRKNLGTLWRRPNCRIRAPSAALHHRFRVDTPWTA